MSRIALNYSLWYHQNQFYKVEKGIATLINGEELADLYLAQSLYVRSVVEGIL